MLQDVANKFQNSNSQCLCILRFQLIINKLYTSSISVTGSNKDFVMDDNTQRIFFEGTTTIPNVLAVVWVRLRGIIRKWQITSDNNGDFTTSFQPLSNEAGYYEIGTLHPLSQDPDSESIASDYFNIYNWQFSPNVNDKIIEYPRINEFVTLNNIISIRNYGDNIIQNIEMINRTFIDGVNITIYPTFINNITSLNRIYLSIDIFVYDLLLDNKLQTIEFIYTLFSLTTCTI